jgi:hypothetical protein
VPKQKLNSFGYGQGKNPFKEIQNTFNVRLNTTQRVKRIEKLYLMATLQPYMICGLENSSVLRTAMSTSKESVAFAVKRNSPKILKQ